MEVYDTLKVDCCKGMETVTSKFEELNDAVRGLSGDVTLDTLKQLGVLETYEFVRKFGSNATGGNFKFQEWGLRVCKNLKKRGLDVKESVRERTFIPSSKPSKRLKPTYLGRGSESGGSASGGGGSAGCGAGSAPYVADDEEEEEEDEFAHGLWNPRCIKLVGDIEAKGVVDLKQNTDPKFLDYLIYASTLSYGPIAEAGSTRGNKRTDCVLLTLKRDAGSVVCAEALMKGKSARILTKFNKFEKMAGEKKGKEKGKAKGKVKAKAKGKSVKAGLQERVLYVIRKNGGTAGYSDIERLDRDLHTEINKRHGDVFNAMVAENVIERVGHGIFRVVV